MNHHCIHHGPPALLALAVSLSAQVQPVEPAAPAGLQLSAAAPIHRQADDQGAPYGLWAAGDHYKASFHDGMTFVPFAARGATLHTLAWHTASATVGEVELVTQAPVLHTTGWRAEYDLGGIVEAYDVRRDGLEQTFVLRQRPAGNGDLVIRGAVTSTLQATPHDGPGAVRFTAPDGGASVEYGAAVAIDARGRKAPLSTSTIAGGLALRLPADWLATAAFPVVVDPLLAAVDINGGVSITDVAIAHDPLGNANVWYAVARAIGTDTDLWLYRADEDGSNAILVYSDLTTTWGTEDPSLGVSRAGAASLLAYTRHTWATDVKRVRLHAHDRADLAFDTSWFHGDLSGLNTWRPVVGSDLSTTAPTSLLLAYQAESTGAFANVATSRIHAYYVDVAAKIAVGNPFAIADAPNSDNERPTIAKVAAGPLRVWTVGCQRANNVLLLGTWDVVLRRVDGTNVSGEFAVDSLLDRHEFAPHLAGLNGRLMLFYVASTTAQAPARPTGDAGHSIRGVRLEWNGSSFAAPHGANVLQANNDPRLQLGGVDYDINSDSHFAMSFRSNVTETVYVRRYGYTGNELVAETVETPAVALGTSVAGGVAFQANDDEFLIAYAMLNPPANTPARMRRLTYPAALAPGHAGTACTTTQLDWFGPQWIGSEICGVFFQGAPANSFTMAVVATSSASLQLFGIGGVHDGCWLLVPLNGPDYLGSLPPIVAGNGYWQLPLPEALSNLTLRVQAITFDPASNELFSSNRLTVSLVK